jgi:hypothetical protein
MSDTPGFSMPIQVVEAGGITAWLAEDHSVPVVSVSWGWDGGAALDPAGAEGTASMAASLLTEGAGTLDALAFADAARDEAVGLSFSVDRDGFDGGFRVLLPALPKAIELARLAMTRASMRKQCAASAPVPSPVPASRWRGRVAVPPAPFGPLPSPTIPPAARLAVPPRAWPP